jgi:hypothetical protein
MLMVELIPRWLNKCGPVLNTGASMKMKTSRVTVSVFSLVKHTHADPALGTISPFALGTHQ